MNRHQLIKEGRYVKKKVKDKHIQIIILYGVLGIISFSAWMLIFISLQYSIVADNHIIHLFSDYSGIATNNYNEMYIEYFLSLIILIFIPIILFYLVYIEIKKDKRKYKRGNRR